jgi:hypothetical protein
MKSTSRLKSLEGMKWSPLDEPQIDSSEALVSKIPELWLAEIPICSRIKEMIAAHLVQELSYVPLAEASLPSAFGEPRSSSTTHDLEAAAFLAAVCSRWYLVLCR